LFEFLHNAKFVPFQVPGLTDPVIHHQVHARLDFVEPSHFDPILSQKIRRARCGIKLLGLAAIIDGDLAYFGVRHVEVLPDKGKAEKNLARQAVLGSDDAIASTPA
jgi:hypothetical protein